jgi:hypothetical protein
METARAAPAHATLFTANPRDTDIDTKIHTASKPDSSDKRKHNTECQTMIMTELVHFICTKIHHTYPLIISSPPAFLI